MEIHKILSNLKKYNISTVVETGELTYIQTHKMISPGSQKFFSTCIYVGYVSELPEKIKDGGIANVICIADATIPQGILNSGAINLYLAPQTTNQFDLLNQIADILIDEATLVASMRKILDTLYANNGLQSLVDTASEVFENPLFISDTDFKILAVTTEAVFKNQTLEEEKNMGYVHLANVQAMRRDGLVNEKIYRSEDIITAERTEIDECWLFKSVKLHGIAVAQIAIVDNCRPFRELDYELLSRFSQIVAIEMEKNDFYKDNRGVMYSYFLSDLLSGKLKNNKAVVQRLNILGWKTYEWFKILVIADSHNEFYQEKQEYIVQHLRQIVPDCRWTIYLKKIVVFMSRPNKKIFTEKEIGNINSFLKSNTLVMGISHSFTNLLETELYYKQAFRAVSVGIYVRPSEAIFDYAEMIPYYVAETVLKRNNASEFCPEAISIIQKYDEEKGTNMVETLEKYLLYVGNPVAAAESLNIHRNTLLYRINKIKELTDFNIEDGNERFLIQLYFKLVEYQKGSWLN